MAISLRALMKLAGYPEEKISKLHENLDYLTEGEKLKLADQAWYFISQNYFLNLNFEKMRILEEVKSGKRNPNPNDLEEVKARLVHELVNKLRSTETETSITEVRQQLEKFKTS